MNLLNSQNDCEITVYIPSRAYGKYLRQSIESVLNQSYTSWELIIIDDGSTDETSIISDWYCLQYKDRIRLIKNASPKGLQYNINKVLSIARGNYILRLDGDDWLHRHALLTLHREITSRPGIVLAFSDYYYTTEAGSVITQDRYMKSETNCNSKSRPPHGACSLIRMRSLKNISGYSEQHTAQDGWELWYKLIGVGETLHVNLPLFYYRQHKSSLSKDTDHMLEQRLNIIHTVAPDLTDGYALRKIAIIPAKPNGGTNSYTDLLLNSSKDSIFTCCLKTAINSSADEIYVYASDKDILSQIESHAITTSKPIIYVQRDPDIHVDYIPVDSIMLEVLNYRSHHFPELPKVDVIVYLNLHSQPSMPCYIDNAVDVLRTADSDVCLSVNTCRKPILRRDHDRLITLNKGRFQNIDLDNEHLYEFSGTLLALWADILSPHSDVLDSKITPIELPSRAVLSFYTESDIKNHNESISRLP